MLECQHVGTRGHGGSGGSREHQTRLLTSTWPNEPKSCLRSSACTWVGEQTGHVSRGAGTAGTDRLSPSSIGEAVGQQQTMPATTAVRGRTWVFQGMLPTYLHNDNREKTGADKYRGRQPEGIAERAVLPPQAAPRALTEPHHCSGTQCGRPPPGSGCCCAAPRRV